MSSASYGRLLRLPGASAFTAAAFVGRLPISMVTLGALLLVEDRTGSYAVGGAVSAALAIGVALLNPWVSRLIDRHGQATVLPAAVLVHAAGMSGLVGLALADTSPPVLVLVGLVAGGALPPVGSCVRARWAALLATRGRSEDLPTAMAWESVVDELVFIVGPVLVVAVSASVDPVAGLALAVGFAVCGCLVLAALRVTQPVPHGDPTGRPSALRLASLRTLTAVGLGMGTLFGGLEVAMVAFADDQGTPGASGLLLGLFALGSGVMGLAYGARTWAWPLQRRLPVAAGLLVVGTAPLLLAPSLGVGAVLALLAGLAVAPTLIALFGLVERLAPAAALTEGFTLVNSGVGVGAAAGSALAGLVADHAAARWAFGVCVGGALVAVVLVAALRSTLAEPPLAPATG